VTYDGLPYLFVPRPSGELFSNMGRTPRIGTALCFFSVLVYVLVPTLYLRTTRGFLGPSVRFLFAISSPGFPSDPTDAFFSFLALSCGSLPSGSSVRFPTAYSGVRSLMEAYGTVSGVLDLSAFFPAPIRSVRLFL